MSHQMSIWTATRWVSGRPPDEYLDEPPSEYLDEPPDEYLDEPPDEYLDEPPDWYLDRHRWLFGRVTDEYLNQARRNQLMTPALLLVDPFDIDQTMHCCPKSQVFLLKAQRQNSKVYPYSSYKFSIINGTHNFDKQCYKGYIGTGAPAASSECGYEIRAKKPSQTHNSGTKGLKVTSVPPVQLEEFSCARRALILPFQQVNAICVANENLCCIIERISKHASFYQTKLGLRSPPKTLNSRTKGLKVTSVPPVMAGQTGCLQGQDRSAIIHPSSSHARRYWIQLSCDNRHTRFTAPLTDKIYVI
ncbi:hypothetical protein J6590_083636 [Homalodisca vitripennis]|nr:hypothetical protein J6590_083636 [Homalodisca vitripennis]